MLGDRVVSQLMGGGRVALIAESFNGMIEAMDYSGAAALGSLLVLTILGASFLLFWVLRRAGIKEEIFAEQSA